MNDLRKMKVVDSFTQLNEIVPYFPFIKWLSCFLLFFYSLLKCLIHLVKLDTKVSFLIPEMSFVRNAVGMINPLMDL